MKRTLTFSHERSTKNTERYAESGDKQYHAVGVLYVQRSAFAGDQIPATITVTIEA